MDCDLMTCSGGQNPTPHRYFPLQRPLTSPCQSPCCSWESVAHQGQLSNWGLALYYRWGDDMSPEGLNLSSATGTWQRIHSLPVQWTLRAHGVWQVTWPWLQGPRTSEPYIPQGSTHTCSHLSHLINKKSVFSTMLHAASTMQRHKPGTVPLSEWSVWPGAMACALLCRACPGRPQRTRPL